MKVQQPPYDRRVAHISPGPVAAEQLNAVDQDGAGHGDHGDVQADGDAGPQVNLEERLSNPDVLRTLQPALPECHGRIFTYASRLCEIGMAGSDDMAVYRSAKRYAIDAACSS